MSHTSSLVPVGNCVATGEAEAKVRLCKVVDAREATPATAVLHTRRAARAMIDPTVELCFTCKIQPRTKSVRRQEIAPARKRLDDVHVLHYE
jgi:hypothetical protein